MSVRVRDVAIGVADDSRTLELEMIPQNVAVGRPLGSEMLETGWPGTPNDTAKRLKSAEARMC